MPPSSAQGSDEWKARDRERLRGDGGLGFGGSFASGFPGPRRQLVDLAGWMIWQSCERVGEPSARIDVVELASLVSISVQTRTRTLDGTLRSTFERWFPGLANDNAGRASQSAAA
jgi:hypothetical protein